MPSIDPRIDAYIKKSAEFAQPVLTYLRELVHKTCPAVEETVKWGFPHFEYKGAILCSMASFKQHCSFGFWKVTLMKDPHKLLQKVGKTSMGHFDRIESMKDLPSKKILMEYIKEAMRLNEEDIKVAKPKAEKAELMIPEELTSALKKNKKAKKTFDAFSYSNKKEYAEWIAGAKTEKTKQERLATAIEWMEEGKIRHWKYVRKSESQ